MGDVLRATATTAILVTHDHDEATALASRVVEWSELQASTKPVTAYPVQPEIS